MFLRASLAICFLLIAAPGKASLEIDIVNGSESALPIAIVPFAYEGAGVPETVVHDVVRNDLARSGLFLPMRESDMLAKPTEAADINWGQWRLSEVNLLLIGKVLPSNTGYTIQFQLYNVLSQTRLLGFSLPAYRGALRDAAHQVSDLIYEEIIGQPGAFSTSIAYVTVEETANGPLYKLQVADADGFRPRTVVQSREPLLSPSWSPDSRKLAYVSFESGNSSIWIQDLRSSQRELVSSYKGINGAPSFSPDGRHLVMALSRTGNPEIYSLNLGTGRLTQLTRHWAIDTEPRYSPDGREIYFTSDRGGKPQIYKMPVDGGNVRRVTRDGDYNARVTISPDGRYLAMARGMGNIYRIAIVDQDTGISQILSDGILDESPSFAPNGGMILYASREGTQGVLSAVSADGRVRQRLVLTEGDVREPAWSPMRR